MQKNTAEQKNEQSSSELGLNYDNFKKSKQYVVKNNYWNAYHEDILKGLQQNTNKLYREYQKAHLVYKKKLRLYRIPIIIMSSLSGFLSISNSGYIPLDYQQWISLFVGFVNLMVTLISLIENFKKIDVNVNKTYSAYIDFKKLHDEISIMLNIAQDEREGNGYDIAMQYFTRYETYITDAPILRKTIHDFLDDNSPDNSSETLMASGSDNVSNGSNGSKTIKLNNQSNRQLPRTPQYQQYSKPRFSDEDEEEYYNSNDDDNYYEEVNIESGIPTTFDGIKKLLNLSNPYKNSGVIKKNMDTINNKKNNFVEMANKKIKNTTQQISNKANQTANKVNQAAQDRIAKVNRFQEQFDQMEKQVDNAIDEKVNKINFEKNLNITQGDFPKITNVKASEHHLLPKTTLSIGETKANLINILKDSTDDFINVDDEDGLVDEGIKQKIKPIEDSSSSSTVV